MLEKINRRAIEQIIIEKSKERNIRLRSEEKMELFVDIKRAVLGTIGEYLNEAILRRKQRRGLQT